MLVKNVDAIHGGDPQVYAADLVSRINVRRTPLRHTSHMH